MTRTFAGSLAWAADGAAHLRGMMLRMGDDAFAARSALPDWTRAHVLTHVARNAEALGNLIEWARTGRPKPAYASREQRNADIATRPRAGGKIRADAMASSEPLAALVRDTPAQAWSATVQSPKGEPNSAADILWWRAREVWFPTPSTSTPGAVLLRPAAGPMLHELLTDAAGTFAGGDPAAPPAVRRATRLGRGRGGGGDRGARGRWRSWRRGCSAGRRAATLPHGGGADGPPELAGLDLTPWSGSPTSPRSVPSRPPRRVPAGRVRRGGRRRRGGTDRVDATDVELVTINRRVRRTSTRRGA